MKKIFGAALAVIGLSLIVVSFTSTQNLIVQKSSSNPGTRTEPRLSEEQTLNTTYVNKKYSYTFTYPKTAIVNEVPNAPGSIEFLDKESRLQFHIQKFSLAKYTELSSPRSAIFQKDFVMLLLELTENYDGFLEDRSLENRSGPPDAGPIRFNILKRKIDGIPALDFRLSSVGSTERIVTFMRNGDIFEIYYPTPFLGEEYFDVNEVTSYNLSETILNTFEFID